ncbi:MAG: hypothetical protein ACLQUZ_16640 [Rhizomicrobium sp.]
MQTIYVSVLAGLALAMIAARAEAQAGTGAEPYRLEEMNFDMWCQEERHLPPERCDKRLPADNAEYEAYVAKIEKYEVPYLQRRRDEERFNRVILHNDPVDRPTEPSVPGPNQPPPQN